MKTHLVIACVALQSSFGVRGLALAPIHQKRVERMLKAMEEFQVRTSVLVLTLLMTAGNPGLCHADIPLMINHQGVVKVDGVPFTGTGMFKFGFMDAAGNWLWTNDLSKLGDNAMGNNPTTPVGIEVKNGVFSVVLGEEKRNTNNDLVMVVLPSSVFNSDEVSLRTIFNDGVNGEQVLAPDQRMTSTAYAFHALSADTATTAGTAQAVETGAITTAMLAADAVDASKIAANAVGSDAIAAGAVGSSEIATGAVGADEITAGAVGSSEIANNAVGASQIAADAVGTSEIAAGAIIEEMFHPETLPKVTVAQASTVAGFVDIIVDGSLVIVEKTDFSVRANARLRVSYSGVFQRQSPDVNFTVNLRIRSASTTPTSPRTVLIARGSSIANEGKKTLSFAWVGREWDINGEDVTVEIQVTDVVGGTIRAYDNGGGQGHQYLIVEEILESQYVP